VRNVQKAKSDQKVIQAKDKLSTFIVSNKLDVELNK